MDQRNKEHDYNKANTKFLGINEEYLFLPTANQNTIFRLSSPIRGYNATTGCDICQVQIRHEWNQSQRARVNQIYNYNDVIENIEDMSSSLGKPKHAIHC
jgi:hypothetical protein